MTDASMSWLVSSSYRLADASHFFSKPVSIPSPQSPHALRTQKKRPCLCEAGSLLCWLARLLALLRVLFLEPLDPTFGIDDLLRAGKKGMAAGANIDVDVPDGRSGLVAVAAGAMHRRLSIQRMNALLHDRTPGIKAFAFAYSKARHFTLSRSTDTSLAV